MTNLTVSASQIDPFPLDTGKEVRVKEVVAPYPFPRRNLVKVLSRRNHVVRLGAYNLKNFQFRFYFNFSMRS